MKRMELVSIGAVLLAGSIAFGGEVGFPEDFALSKDRSAALKQLIPGTPEYYYYTCLHLQNTGQLDKVVPLLKLWVERHGQTALYEQIRNRQALLGYEKEPAASLEFIRWRLGVTLDHQKDVLNKKPDLPTVLDNKLISRERLVELELNRDTANIAGFEAGALEWLAGQKINGYQRRALLQRLARPDVANMVELVAADLDFEHSGGFGGLPIHLQMTQGQLDELLKKKGDLIKQTNFVFAYLTKLQPNPDVDWRHDAKERQAYLDRLWEFVSRLAPAHNSIKAHVLYHRLAHDRAAGVYDKDRFGEYLKLPRGGSYVNLKYLERREMAENMCDLNADYSGQTLLTAIRADDELVRDYLMQFFAQADDWKAYQDYIDSNYLKQAFAECKLVNGQGDAEKWYSLLSPYQVAALKDRIDLDFARTNKEIFAPDDPVALDLLVKNVKTLIVKVYQINALNYYRQFGREVDAAINLDGLVANEEKVVNYDDAPILRVKRHFEFDSMKARGVYVVDFIGNGKASRVLVRKGQLHFLQRTSSAGVILTVLDEANNKVADAVAILGGQTYKADSDGTICIPYSTSGKTQIILTQGDFACLTPFDHPLENYSLSAGFHVEREALLKRRTATVAIRPTLLLNGEPVSISLLEQPRLIIQTGDLDGVPTAKEVPDIKLFEDRETTYEFQVPDRLAGISFTLTGKVQNLSQAKKIDLAAFAQFPLNQIDRSDDVADVHMARIDGKYFLYVLGKTGEGRPDMPVSLSFKHEDFTQPIHTSLKTDANGRIALGELADISKVSAQLNNEKVAEWFLSFDMANMPGRIHGQAGQTLHVPYMGKAKDASRAVLSLLEKRGSTYVKDWFANLAIKDGFIQVKDLPPGEYELTVKDYSDQRILVGITAGEKREGYVLGQKRQLQTANEKPLQIVSIDAGKDEIRIQLANSGKFARVHLAATRFMPMYPLFSDLYGGGAGVRSLTLEKPETAYQTGRNIGDEYRYIIDRKYAIKFPGNMLARPGLLLNPWSITKTQAGVQQAQEGGGFAAGGSGAGPKGGFYGGGGSAPLTLLPSAGYSNFDFLASAATTIFNLQPDENGVVKIPRKDIGPHNQLHILAVDPLNTVYRELSLPEVPEKPLDLTLSPPAALDVAKHFTEQKRITVLTAGKELTLADVSTAQMEVFDTLARAYRLYATLNRDANLAEFSFILEWPKFKDEEKRQKYSKYACHELNFFLARRDKAFFEQVVQPYLKNKKDKTFMDHYLLGDDLKDYLQPWKYEHLNTVERILLGRRIKDEQAVVARHVKDMYDLMPPDVDRFNYLFLTALKGAGLDIPDGGTLYLGGQKLAINAGFVRETVNGVPVVSKVRTPGSIERSSQGIDLPTVTEAIPVQPTPAPKADVQAKEMLKLRKFDDAETRALKEGRDADKNQEIEDHKQLVQSDLARRKEARQLYRKLDKTEEFVENNYHYNETLAQENSSSHPMVPYRTP
ncbi:MAG: hypothetical protein HZA50_17205 [Planctomycetes bacterium]|nr:hypothetical protein [Planctomycetota bacterium]